MGGNRLATVFGEAPVERMAAERDSRSPIDDSMDLLRLLEYPQMVGKTYLDHGGTTPWAKSLVNTFASSMMDDLYGNPHSQHRPSVVSDNLVEATRLKALRFFNADPEKFDLIFVANATAAIKLVHDCFRDYAADPEGRNWWYGYHKDSHTSLVGCREGTRTHRCFRNDREVDLWIDSRGLSGAAPHDVGLFAYPAQSNMTGRRLPLDWPVRIKNRVKTEMFTLLDAAAYCSTAQLDLSDSTRAPDFVSLSFYKIFGFPNLGALIVKKTDAVTNVMTKRKFFGGGTVDMVISVNDSWVDRKSSSLHGRLEDGTLPFTSIFALDIGIDVHKKLYGPNPMRHISTHTSRLAKRMYGELTALQHSNGVPVVKVYKDSSAVYGESHLQGATIAFNIQKSIGGLVSHLEFEAQADKRDIFVRSGSLCNPGGTASYLNWSPRELREANEWGHKCTSPEPEFRGKALGVIRASLGGMSNDADVDNLVAFIREEYIDKVFLKGGPITMSDELTVPKSAGTGRDVTAAVFRISDDPRCTSFKSVDSRASSAHSKASPSLITGRAIGHLRPPSATPGRYARSDDLGRADERLPAASVMSKSTVRRVRRSIMGVLHINRSAGRDGDGE